MDLQHLPEKENRERKRFPQALHGGALWQFPRNQ